MEEFALEPVIENARGKDVVLSTFKDRSGTNGLAILVGADFYFVVNADPGFVGNLYQAAGRIVCYDARELLTFARTDRVIYDVKLLYGGESRLFQLAKEHLDDATASEAVDLDRKYKAHIKACQTAQMDMDRHSLLKLLPSRFVQSLCKIRARVTSLLFEKCLRYGSAGLQVYERETWPFAKALYCIEDNGIRVDQDFVREQLKLDRPAHESKFFRHMAQSQDGYVRTRFNPCGGKTGRIKVEDGFNCMGIPHGDVRNAIVSRHGEHGQIVAFDYNAIDYRSIVAAVPDEAFRKLYEGCEDFHARTTSFLFGDQVTPLRRNVVKFLSYVYIYGGSEETLAERTGLSIEKVREAMPILDHKMRPIADFRRDLSVQARKDGFVTLPFGRKIPIDSEDHDGKIIGLFAQGFSSYVFQLALVAVQEWMGYNFPRESKLIFTVHDELVMDHHTVADPKLPMIVKELLENAVEGHVFRVNVKKGRTYGEATDG
jgi:DNA polymerase I-like protein with 3'-5' exonuclease and polymerase domains